MSDLGNIISELEQQKAAIERALSALREIGDPPRPGPGRPKKSAEAIVTKKRILSPEGRRRIIAATKKRWAAKRSAEASQRKTAPTAKKKHTMTSAARKRLSELMKARWASKNPPKPVARKKAV